MTKLKTTLKQIEGMGVPELNEAVNAYNKITTSTEYQELERMRHKAECDEANALALAEERGEERGEKRAAAKWQKKLVAKDEIIKKLNALLEDKQSK